MMFKTLDRLLDTMLFLILLAMVSIVSANVFCRFVLNFSIYWGDEAAQALLVWLTFIGAAVAVRDRAHYSFDYLARLTRGPAQTVVAVTSRVITIVALAGFFYWGMEVAIGIRPWIMPAMQISRVYVYAAGPIGCAMMLIYAVRDLIRVVRERRLPPEAAPAA